MADLRSQLQDTLGAAYIIERELGGGGMSRVFIAEEVALGRKVVVKVLPPDIAASVNVERFRREIQTSAKLQHPHIVPVHSAGEMHGVPYYTMPFVEGESLRARLTRAGALSITEAVGVLRDLAKALAYAHDHGVVHRDIKPDNILLSGGSATVADFGIAKAISASRDDAPSGTLTQVGTSLGTPAYMAPEQAAADPATNHRTDIYAFGCVAYEVVAGRPPFIEKTPHRLLAAQMGERPQPIAELRPDTPPELADLIMKCLEKEPDDRPQRASDLVRVLETVTSGGGHAALPAILMGGPGMLRRALAYYAAAFVIVLVVAQAAVVTIGLPDWVVPGTTVVMLLGLPMILLTAYAQRVTRRAITMTPTYTPGGTPSLPQGTFATIAIKASPHLSWRRTTLGGVYALGAFVFLIAAFMVLRALGIGPAGSLFAAGKLNANDRLIVADFGVKGSADSALGTVVAEAIRTDLGQSRAVSIASASTIRNALQRMQRAPDRRLDLPLARELAQREGLKAVVHGDITPIGAGFIVTVRLVSADSGNELASFRETADGPRELIPAVEKLSRSLRAKMGESLKSVRATPPLEQVTTSSLDALRKFTEGNAIADLDVGRAIGLLKEAVAIDTTFAMAWRKLSALYGNAGYSNALRDSATVRAYRARDRLTESERDNVEGFYYGVVLEDRARELQVYERVMTRGDLDLAGAAAHNLALALQSRREMARAESLYRAIVAHPGAAFVSYGNLAGLLYNAGKTSASDSVIAVANAKFNQPGLFLPLQVAGAYDAGRFDSAAKLLDSARKNRDVFVRAVSWRIGANFKQARGQLAAAERDLAQARIVDSTRGGSARPLFDSVRFAMMDVWLREQPDRAIRRLDMLQQHVPLQTVDREERPYFYMAAAYVRAGRPDRARAVLARYAAEVRDTMRQRIDAPARNRALAEIALAEHRFPDALELFRRGDQLPDGPVSECVPCFLITVARAFDAAGQADSAIVYLARYQTTPSAYRLGGAGPEVDATFRAWSHRRLGELYEQRGDKQRAAQQYMEFVNLWKDADPDLQPKVAEVRRRLARIGDTERK